VASNVTQHTNVEYARLESCVTFKYEFTQNNKDCHTEALEV